MPRAYDLIGDVTAPAEIFPRQAALAAMVDSLTERGLHDAADESSELLKETQAFAALMQSRAARLSRLWKAVEVAAGPVADTGAATQNITVAAMEYRAVKKHGTGRDLPPVYDAGSVFRTAPPIGCMEPFFIVTTPEELAALRVDAIICPPRIPSSALRKAWAGIASNDGRSDLFVGFDSTREWNSDEAWQILTTNCPADAPEAWVLWDPTATAPAPLKPSSWVTIIPGRRPVRKAHTGLGLAKSAIGHQMYNGVAHVAMELHELDTVTGEYVLLHAIPKGTLKTDLPW